MAKRRKPRKRSNKNVPAKGVLSGMAHKVWSRAVRDDWGNKCAVCGTTKTLQAHHLIPCEFTRFRYLLRCGICLCASHHKLDPVLAPHRNSEGFVAWLKKHHPDLKQWYSHNNPRRLERFGTTKNWCYYCDILMELRQYVSAEDFERICGIKFSAWLENRND